MRLYQELNGPEAVQALKIQQQNDETGNVTPITHRIPIAQCTTAVLGGFHQIIKPPANVPISRTTNLPVKPTTIKSFPNQVNSVQTGNSAASTTKNVTHIPSGSGTTVPQKRYPWQIPRTKEPEISQSQSSIIGLADSSKNIKKEKPWCSNLATAANHYLDDRNRPSTSNALPKKPDASKQISEIIAVETKRKSPTDYYMPALNNFIKESLDHWNIINISPAIDKIFYSIRGHFFRHCTGISAYRATWSDSFTDSTNFKIDPEKKSILLNPKTLMKCSRGNLIEVVFHILIHCSVYGSSQARGKEIYDHDANFM